MKTTKQCHRLSLYKVVVGLNTSYNNIVDIFWLFSAKLC